MSKSQNIPNDPNYTIGENNKRRLFAKGNQIGRMKKKGYTIKDLTNTAIEYEKTHDLTILKHYIKQLFKDNKLLEKYIDRYVPPKQINEHSGLDGLPINVTLNKVIYSEEKEK